MEASDNTHEYIWIGDFKDRSLGVKVFGGLGVRTFGELALTSEVELKEAGLDDNEQITVSSMLLTRGLVKVMEDQCN